MQSNGNLQIHSPNVEKAIDQLNAYNDPNVDPKSLGPDQGSQVDG